MSGEQREQLIELATQAIYVEWGTYDDDIVQMAREAAAAVVDALGIEHVGWGAYVPEDEYWELSCYGDVLIQFVAGVETIVPVFSLSAVPGDEVSEPKEEQ